MRKRQLICFLAVCKQGSMSSAAKDLGIAQPALSKQISQLEHELETVLFERHNKGVRLTNAGMRLQNEASDLIRRFESVKDAVRISSGEISGNVTMVVISSLAPDIAARLYPYFEKNYPNISLRIVDFPSHRACEAILHQEADIAIVPNSATDLQEIESIPLFEESFHLISKNMNEPVHSPIPFAEAVAKPLVLPFHDHDLRRRLEETARNVGVQINVKYETGSINVIDRLVEDGIINSIVPLTFWKERIKNNRIVSCPIANPTVSRVHSICWSRKHTLSPATEIAKKVASQEISQMIQDGLLLGSSISKLPTFQ